MSRISDKTKVNCESLGYKKTKTEELNKKKSEFEQSESVVQRNIPFGPRRLKRNFVNILEQNHERMSS